MDSDALIDANLVSDFRNHFSLNSNIDVFAFSMIAFQGNIRNVVYENSHIYPEKLAGSGINVLAELILKKNFHSSSCMFILRNQLIDMEKNGFYNIIHEDEEFTQRLFINSRHIQVVTTPYYFYRQFRYGSIMNSVKKFNS